VLGDLTSPDRGPLMQIPEARDLRNAVLWAVGTLIVLTIHPSSLLAQLVITVLAAVASVIT